MATRKKIIKTFHDDGSETVTIDEGSMSYGYSSHPTKTYRPSNFFKDLFDVLFWFNWDMAHKPIKLILFVVLRLAMYFALGYAYEEYRLWKVQEYLDSFFLGDLLLLLISLYGLFHVLSTIVMATVMYKGTSSDSGFDDTSEIEKFLSWRDNKMKFMNYKEAAELMRKTAVLNNLDPTNPEAKKTLGYINNRMKFMSYPDAVKFLNGEKK